MFRAEILWLANAPTLKMEGKLVGEWAEQARCLVTADVVPKGLVVDLTEVSYIDSSGERLLIWFGECRRTICRQECLHNYCMRKAGLIVHAENARTAVWE